MIRSKMDMQQFPILCFICEVYIKKPKKTGPFYVIFMSYIDPWKNLYYSYAVSACDLYRSTKDKTVKCLFHL